MPKRINVYDFEYEYSHRAPSSGGSSSMNFKTPNQGSFVNYYLADDSSKGYVEFLSVYESGLILHVKQTASEILFKSNREFNLQDNGNFELVTG